MGALLGAPFILQQADAPRLMLGDCILDFGVVWLLQHPYQSYELTVPLLNI